jgi:hypothetical protein
MHIDVSVDLIDHRGRRPSARVPGDQQVTAGGIKTGSERFTRCVKYLVVEPAGSMYWSGLVMTGLGEFGCVASPVASGLVHPAGGCGGCGAEKVGEDCGGELCGEIEECGPATWHRVDAKAA